MKIVGVVLAVSATWTAGGFGGGMTTVIGILCLAVMVPLLLEVVAVVATAIGNSGGGLHGSNNSSGSGKVVRSRQSGLQGALGTLSDWLNPPSYLFDGMVVAAVIAFVWGAIYAHWSGLVMHDSFYEVLLLHVLPSIWINTSIFVHLYMAATTNPGRPPSSVASESSAVGFQQRCKRCDAVQLPGTHHCRTCKQCCVEMDHHCPFIANCVGKNNYRHFFAFVLWSWLATLYAVWLTRLPSTYCSQADIKTAGCAALSKGTGSLSIASIASCAALSGIMGLIVYLLSTKQSTRTFVQGRKRDKATMDATSMDYLVSRLGPVREWWRYWLPWGWVLTPSTILNQMD